MAKSARFILASTSEVYGEPVVHPQTEDYWGNVNPIGPRSVYDEAKRYAEALTPAYRTSSGVDTGIVRIFNTYGPRMRSDDGRVVSNFVHQSLTGQPLTVFGHGKPNQKSLLCRRHGSWHPSDARFRRSGPNQSGQPDGITVIELAELVLKLTGSSSRLELKPLPEDDPTRRRPDITRARTRLGWNPRVPVREGIARTIEWHAKLLRENPEP